MAASGLDVGALSTVMVSWSTAGTEGLSSQTKETSHGWFLCSGGQTFASERASEAAPGVEDQALCLRGATLSRSPDSGTAMQCASQVFTHGRGKIGGCHLQEHGQGSVVMRSQRREQEMWSTSIWSFLQAPYPPCLSFPCSTLF